MISFVKDVVKKFFQVLVRFPLHLAVLLLGVAAVNWVITYIPWSNYLTAIITTVIGVVLVSVFIDLVEHRVFSVSRVASRITINHLINSFFISLVLSLPLILIAVVLYLMGSLINIHNLLSAGIGSQILRFFALLYMVTLTGLGRVAIIRDNLRVDRALDKSLSIILKNILGIATIYCFFTAPDLVSQYVQIPCVFVPVVVALGVISQALISVIIYTQAYKRS